MNFYIQSDSEIPASTQLFNQLRFAIASRQYSPGEKLPSTRQLAEMTNLHRNTISKVYRQLEMEGLVDSQAGSGIYVRKQGHEVSAKLGSEYSTAYQLIQQSLDELLNNGYTLNQVRELFLNEIDWRWRCSAKVLVTAPLSDMGVGELMTQDLAESLAIPVQLVPLEELIQVLEQTTSATVVTSRYFISEAEAIAIPKAVRVIPIDICDYNKELDIVRNLPKGMTLGIVSISSGILRVVEVIIHSWRGEDLLVLTAQVKDQYKLNAIIHNAHTIISDKASYSFIKLAILAVREDLIRQPRLICSENYIDPKSINMLKRELGLG